jgi:hypothetical protein
MKFVPITKDNVSVYAAWFEDAELHKHLSPPDTAWLDHVTSNGQAWLCFEENQAVAQIQLDTAGFLLQSSQPDQDGFLDYHYERAKSE